MILRHSLQPLVRVMKVGYGSEQYATGYLAVKYLHSRIVASGQADGVKHMTTWMKTQFDTSQGCFKQWYR